MLANLITRLRNRHVFIALFTSPEYRDDSGYYSPVYQALDSLVKAQNVPYLDFNRGHHWPLDETFWFKDDGHLNSEGAERLSQALRQWLQPYSASFSSGPANRAPSNGNNLP